MKKILIYFIKFSSVIGGGEYLPLLFLSEFQKRGHDVTMAVYWEGEVEQSAKAYGIPIDTSKLKVVRVKPEGRWQSKIDAVIPVFRTMALRKLAKQADIRISALNIVDFGRPAHHFISDIQHGQFADGAFCDYAHHRTPTGIRRGYRKIRRFLMDRILRPVLRVRSTGQIVTDKAEHIYPNSLYIETLMRDFYGSLNSEVLYPPTTFEVTHELPERDPLRVVYLGRIHPQKKITDIIGMVGKARAVSGKNLTLHVAGPLPDSPYVEQLRRLADATEWLFLHDALYGRDKERFLASGAFAIHAQRDEAFGISITEYLKAGLIPIVPDEGGSPEVVASPELAYHDDDEAVKILVRLLDDAEFRETQQRHCAERAKDFSLPVYLKRQQEVLNEILKGAETRQRSRIPPEAEK